MRLPTAAPRTGHSGGVTAPDAAARTPAAARRVPFGALGAVRRPALTGALAVVALVVAASRAPMPVGVRIAPSFWGLLAPSRSGGTAQAVVALLAVAVLVACWWRVLHAVTAGAASTRDVVRTALLWSAPVLLGPPLLSMDAYAYLAQGQMLLQGLDPYTAGPILLGDTAAAARVDPMWRSAPVPYGPLALVLLRAVAWLSSLAGGSLVVGVLLLRLVAVVGVAAAIAGALALASRERRPFLLALLVLNPVTLIHLLGGVHLDAVAAGLVTVALVALVSRRLSTAWWLSVAAVGVKVTAAPLAVFTLLALRGAGRSWKQLGLACAAGIAVPLAVSRLAMPRPWGFLSALTVPGEAPAWYSAASLVSRTLAAAAWVAGIPLPPGIARAAGAVLAIAAGGTVVGWLLRDAARAPLHTGRNTAAALMVAAVALPSLHAWYVAAGLFGLAALGARRETAALVVLSSGLAFSSLPPLYGVNVGALAAAWLVVVVLLTARGRTELSAFRPHTPAGHDRAAAGPAGNRVALMLSAGLVLPAAVGLVAPSASAGGVAATAPAAGVTDEQVRLLRQLDRQYPGRHATTVRAQETVPARYDVELVGPGAARCQLVLERVIGPQAAFARLRSPVEYRWEPGVEAPPCPAPTVPPVAAG